MITGVDEAFETLLFAVFGKELIDEFRRRRPAGTSMLNIIFLYYFFLQRLHCIDTMIREYFRTSLVFYSFFTKGFIDMMIAFESRKRSACPHKLTPLNLALPFSFIDFYR